MKKLIILSFALLLTSLGQAQDLDQYLDKYENAQQFSKMSLTSDVLRMFAQDYDQRKIIDKIDKVNVYLFNDGIKLEKEELRGLKSELKSNAFEQLINVKDKQLKVDIFVKEKGDNIKRLFMVLLTDGTKQIIADMKCNLTYKDFQDLELSFEGAENLKMIGKSL